MPILPSTLTIRKIFLPVASAYNDTDAVAIALANGQAPLPVSKISHAVTMPCAIPNECTEFRVWALVQAEAIGDVYCSLVTTGGSSGESPTTHTDSTTSGPETLGNTGYWYLVREKLADAFGAGDMVTLKYYRTGTNINDTIAGTVNVYGFLMESSE